MKKLMTMLSAATVAIGLYAETYTDTGTSFERATADVFDWENAVDDLGDNATGYWGSDTNTWTVVEGTSISHKDKIGEENAFPDQFDELHADIAQHQYLKIASPFGTPLTRYVKQGGALGVDLTEMPLFFDSLVRFTAFDAGDLPTQVTNELESAKIAVWIQAVDDEGTQTNLYVRAGKFVNGEVQAHTYDCGLFRKADAWHRLTIKAMGGVYQDGTVPGFAVFVDNQPEGIVADPEDPNPTGIDASAVGGAYLGLYNDGLLFPSMDQTTSDSTVINSVSFDGQGDIDDVVFTQRTPFDAAKSAETVTFTWTSAVITNLTIAGALSIDLVNGTAIIPFTTGGMTVQITNIQYAEGYMGDSSATITFDANKETSDTLSYNDVVAYFGETPYASVDDAVTAAIAANDPTTTLKLYNTEGVEEVENSDNAAEVTFDLNGQSLGSLVLEQVVVTLQDSVGTGKVNGYVFFAEGSTITGGAFLIGDNVNSKDVLDQYVPNDNVEFLEGEGDFKGYFVLTEKSAVTEIAVPTAATGLVYNGNEQTGVVAGTDYTLTGTAAATDAGEYTATATPKAGYAWVGGSTDATNITWSIAKAQVTATVSLTVTEATYDSEKNTVTAYTTPSVNFGLDAPELVENTDYTVAWSATEVTGAGTFTYTVSPVQGSNYTFTEASATLTITAGGGGLDPEDGTVEVVINDAQDGDDAIAKAKAAIGAPTGATVDTAVYADYFTYNAAGEAGTYTVTITGVKDEIKADVLGSAVERLTNAEATIVEVPAGLYYSITPSTSLPISGTATKGLSTGGTVEVGKPGSTAGFYEIKLSATPIND